MLITIKVKKKFMGVLKLHKIILILQIWIFGGFLKIEGGKASLPIFQICPSMEIERLRCINRIKMYNFFRNSKIEIT